MSKENKTIQQLEEELESAVDLGSFILNYRVLEIQKQIEELQSKCQHHYVDGICIHCHKLGGI